MTLDQKIEAWARRLWTLTKRCTKRMRAWRVRMILDTGVVEVTPSTAAVFADGDVVTICEPDDVPKELWSYVKAVDCDHAIERILPKMLLSKQEAMNG